MARSLGALLAEAWDTELRESPAVSFGSEWLFSAMTGKPMPLYRTRLDQQPRNQAGELIPRIVTVRRNLRHLGSIRLDPSRLR